jgi:hypothetical protein
LPPRRPASGAFGAEAQKFGKLHGRTRPALHLLSHGALILAQDLLPAASFELARLHIQKDVEFPRQE